MLAGLHVGFGNLIGADLLAELAARGVRMIRSDYLRVQTPEDIPILIGEVIEAGLVPLSVIRPDQATWLPPAGVFGPLDVEIWNEPDLGTPPTPRMHPGAYAGFLTNAVQAMPAGHHVWGGVISNLDEDSLDWLAASILAGWPGGVGVSVHRYPPNGARPQDAHRGFRSRADETTLLRDIIADSRADRPWGVSEFGYHRGPQSSGPWYAKKRWAWTPEQQAEFTAWDVGFWAQQGAAFACAYQVNSGPTDHYLDQFGWRNDSGHWFPVADVLRGRP